MRWIIVSFTLNLAWASDVPLTIQGSTATQLVIRYTASSADPCSVSLVDNNGGTNPPRDVDPNLFPGSNTDLGRSIGNGFRWPTIAAGLDRTVFLGGHDEIKKASDGRWYSTALQANSDHTITVSCNGGADTGTIHGMTQNVPVGSYYPELPIPTPGSPMGGVPQPSINWNDRKQSYIDPISGVLIKPITLPLDDFDGSPIGSTFVAAVDPNAAWTSPGNALTNQDGGRLASTSTPGSPLFLAWNQLSFNCCGGEISDVRVSLFGSSQNGTEIAEVCVTEDSGQSCASDPIDVVFTSSGARLQDSIPSSANHALNANYPFPSNFFGGWGAWSTSFGEYDLANQTFTGINASDNSVSMPAVARAGFNIDRPAGSVFRLTNCASGPDVTLHVSSIPTVTQIIAEEAGLSNSNCTYTEYSSGIRITLKNSGTLRLSATYALQFGTNAPGGSNGQRYYCAATKVTDISRDCDGNPQSPPLTGRLCQFPTGVYLFQDNGRVCPQSNQYATASQGGGHLRFFFNLEDAFFTNKSLIKMDSGPTHDVWSATLDNGGDYTEFRPTADHSVADHFKYTNLSSSATPITTQVINAGGTLANALKTGLWKGGLNIATASQGYLMYSIFAGGDATLCAYAYTDSNLNLIRTSTSWDTYPLRWGGCHTAPQMLGKYAFVTAGNRPFHFDKTTLLGGPFVTGLVGMRKNGVFQQYTISITSATPAKPVVLTSAHNDIASFRNVGQNTGAYMTCQGGAGAWSAINGDVYAKKLDDDTFSLYADAALSTPVDGSSFGPFSGTVTCTMAPALYNIRVTHVGDDGSGNARVTVALDDAGYSEKFPDHRLVVQDADPINFQRLNPTAQYYAKITCSGCAPNQFDVYKDAALSTPAPASEISGADAHDGTVSYAETCPDPSTIHLPGPQYGDSGFASGATPNSRCVTFRINTEPCSWWASAGEGAAYPCPTDPSNAAKSSLQDLAVGDGLYMLDQGFNYEGAEIFYVLSKNKISPTQIEVTTERWYGDALDYKPPRDRNNYIYNHPFGGWLLPVPTIPTAWIDFTSTGSWIPESPAYPGGHRDVSLGSRPGNVILAAPFAGGTFDDLFDVPITELSATASRTHDNFPVWANDVNDTGGSIVTALESYPDNRHVFGEAPAIEMPIKSDWMAINPLFGNGRNAADGVFPMRTPPLNIRGTQYDPDNSTSIVYKLSNQTNSGKLNIKLIPNLVHASPHVYFADKSGANSVLRDADVGKMCVAYEAGECRPNSNAGDVFVAMNGYAPNTYCLSNAGTLSAPCLYPLWPGAGWAVEIAQQPVDFTGSLVRRLTMGFTLPLAHYSFQNWTASPDGKWGFFSTNPIQFRPAKGADSGIHYFAMKLPPWPGSSRDHFRGKPVDRRNFVPIPVAVTGTDANDTVRVGFGYAENGDPNNLYCTTRLETCWTSASATNVSPFLFDHENQSRTSCGSSCTVSVPAVPGRILFYKVEHSNGSTDPLQVVVAP